MLPHHFNFVSICNCLQEWIKVNITDEEVASWVLWQLIELSLIISYECTEMRSTYLGEE